MSAYPTTMPSTIPIASPGGPRSLPLDERPETLAHPPARRSAVKRSALLLAAVSVCTLAIAYWHWRVVASVKLPQAVSGWNQDLYNIYYPCYAFGYRSARFLPLWNPHQ